MPRSFLPQRSSPDSSKLHADRYTLAMLTPLLILAFGCSSSEPPPAPVVEPEVEEEEPAPKKKKKPRNASAEVDTGAPSDEVVKEIRYEPSKAVPHENITVAIDLERSGRYIDVDYEWEVNGKRLLSEREETLPQTRFSKGDTVQAFLTIRVGDSSIEREGNLLIVGNTPPRILTNPRSLSKLDGFRIRAEDPDGGAVTYHVKGGPPGLSIGESTGVVKYTPSKTAEAATHPIVFVVRDADGAESEWRLSINVSAGSESESAQQARAKRKADWEAERAAKKAKREAEIKSAEEE